MLFIIYIIIISIKLCVFYSQMERSETVCQYCGVSSRRAAQRRRTSSERRVWTEARDGEEKHKRRVSENPRRKSETASTRAGTAAGGDQKKQNEELEKRRTEGREREKVLSHALQKANQNVDELRKYLTAGGEVRFYVCLSVLPVSRKNSLAYPTSLSDTDLAVICLLIKEIGMWGWLKYQVAYLRKLVLIIFDYRETRLFYKIILRKFTGIVLLNNTNTHARWCKQGPTDYGRKWCDSEHTVWQTSSSYDQRIENIFFAYI